MFLGLELQSPRPHPPFSPPKPTGTKDGTYYGFLLKKDVGYLVLLWRICLWSIKLGIRLSSENVVDHIGNSELLIKNILFSDLAEEHGSLQLLYNFKKKGLICLCQFLISSLQSIYVLRHASLGKNKTKQNHFYLFFHTYIHANMHSEVLNYNIKD